MIVRAALLRLLFAIAALLTAQPALADGRPPAGTANCEGADDQPLSLQGSEAFVYRTASGRDLRIHVSQPSAQTDRPAVIFFFGGGWRRGSIAQFVEQARALQARGYVTALADYRVFCRDSTTPMDAVDDARAAYDWFVARSGQFNVDRQRIALAGGSSGGQLAAATAQMAPAGSRPGALILFNPAIDLTPPMIRNAIGIGAEDADRISPSKLPVTDAPPMIIFHGVNDQVAPIRHSRDFCERVRAAQGQCTLAEYSGLPHGFFNIRTPMPGLTRSPFEDTLAGAIAFLTEIGWP